MIHQTTFFGYFWHASIIVKLVMLVLLAASIASWTVIFQRGKLLKETHQALNRFERVFWSTTDLVAYYKNLKNRQSSLAGLEAIFVAGFEEYLRLHQQGTVKAEDIMEGAKRAMRVAGMRELDTLESGLPFLATVGSVSPYIGLFGTVWGIMIALHALGNATQTTIGMVAPGISEALVATAMGLFAAIPAVIAYNRYSTRLDRIFVRYDAFQEEFAGFLYRQAQTKSS
ncbi:MAG: protein TolQ [Pseudomonadota bacterium]